MVVLVVVVVILELITIDIKKCEKYKEEKLNLEKTRNLKLKTQNPKTILIVTKQKNDDEDNNLITSITKQIRIV